MNKFPKKNMENVRNNSDIKLIIADSRRNYLVSEANHHTRKRFWDDVFSNRNEEKTPQILMSQKPVYLGLSIIETKKIVMYEFSYNYAKTKYAKLC